jgi:hypothetical protein
MTKTALKVDSNRSVVGLSCIWSLTGERDHALACRWIPEKLHVGNPSACASDSRICV